MHISIIAAMDRNRLIGDRNQLPWHLPADLAHFKRVTMGKPVIMGRNTFESIGRPLPGRTNVVVSRKGFETEGVVSVDSIDSALASVNDAEEVMIIGGANFYEQMIDKADYLYLTHVDAECEGDAWFPDFNDTDWEVIKQESYKKDEKNNFDFRTVTYRRNK